MRRRQFIALISGAATWPFAPRAQQPVKVSRIGFLGATTPSAWEGRVEAFRAGLREFGYVEGENIIIEFRWAEGKYDRLLDFAADLARIKVDVIVTHGTPGTRAAGSATTTIPIVMLAAGDALATGLVTNLARPGGNITGSSFIGNDLMAKRLELAKETIPRIAEVAVLINPDNAVNQSFFPVISNMAGSRKINLRYFEARRPNEFDATFSAMVKEHVDFIVISDDGVFLANDKTIAGLASKYQIPSTGSKEYAEIGGLMGYGPNFVEMYRYGAYFVDKILKGAKPADLPVQQPTKFELVVNLKTAKALGLTIPQSILLPANEVIE